MSDYDCLTNTYGVRKKTSLLVIFFLKRILSLVCYFIFWINLEKNCLQNVKHFWRRIKPEYSSKPEMLFERLLLLFCILDLIITRFIKFSKDSELPT